MWPAIRRTPRSAFAADVGAAGRRHRLKRTGLRDAASGPCHTGPWVEPSARAEDAPPPVVAQCPEREVVLDVAGEHIQRAAATSTRITPYTRWRHRGRAGVFHRPAPRRARPQAGSERASTGHGTRWPSISEPRAFVVIRGPNESVVPAASASRAACHRASSTPRASSRESGSVAEVGSSAEP